MMDKLISLFIKLIPNWIKPNYLSIIRIVFLLPILIFLYSGQKTLALIFFLFAVFLDVLDGALARLRNQTTKSGEWLDPLADKLLIFGIVFIYGLIYFPIWIIVPMIFLEILLVLGRPIKVKLNISAKANKWGKIKMAFQSLGIIALIIDPNSLRLIFISFFILAIFFAILSILSHLQDIIKVKK
jgi:CDP-diacylglycerol--glycerol-3-phosphate 3-phosphatidyltransferase